MREAFLAFLSCFAIRRTKKQKIRFCENVEHLCKELSLPLQKIEGKVGIKTVKHLAIGTMTKARYLLLAGYDTTERALLASTKYDPLCTSANRKVYFQEMVLRLLGSLVLSIAGCYLIYHATNQQLGLRIVQSVGGAFLLIFSIFFMRGFSNQATFSKSAAVFLLLQAMKEKKSERLCYALLDDASFSRLGFTVWQEQMPKTNIIPIYLDCLGMGDTLLIGYQQDAKKEAERLQSLYPGKSMLRPIMTDNNNRFADLKHVISLSFVFLDEQEEPYVQAVRTEKDLTVDLTAMQELLTAIEQFVA